MENNDDIYICKILIVIVMNKIVLKKRTFIWILLVIMPMVVVIITIFKIIKIVLSKIGKKHNNNYDNINHENISNDSIIIQLKQMIIAITMMMI